MERYLDEDEEYEDEEFTEQDQDRLDLQEFAKKSISMKTEAKDHFSGLFMMFMVKNHPEQVIDYCTAMGRAKELEDYIALNPSLACQYAEEVIMGRSGRQDRKFRLRLLLRPCDYKGKISGIRKDSQRNQRPLR